MPTAKALFLEAGRLIVDLCRRYYQEDDSSVLPRNIASFEAFENAMCLDIAMGGSTNTILHLLAAAQEGGVDFTMSDIDRLSKKVPNICKVAPATELFHVEDVHRAGGVMSILAELNRGGLLHNEVPTIREASLFEALVKYDVATNEDEALHEFYHWTRWYSDPSGVQSSRAIQQVGS